MFNENYSPNINEVLPKNISNLNPEMQAKVRTPEFKSWFGDWENDPEDASKIIDENGEPLIVYKGAPANIEAFVGDKRARTGHNEIGFYATRRK